MVAESSASELVARIRSGMTTSEAVTAACLERIEATDDRIGAWTYIDRDHALCQARELDRMRQAGRPLGALHGVPVGVKDIFDTADMPTCNGSVIDRGRRPIADSAVVERLREAGAVILGKTATTEFAFLHPCETVNPHDPSRTPGGSSSGSAAAVAAGHVPLAVGSQTNGSTIRPASFCGIFGLKPTRGMISRRGMFEGSGTLDQVGVFARTLEDTARLADVLKGFDGADPASYNRPKPSLAGGYGEDPPLPPIFAWFDLPYADRLEQATRDGFDELVAGLEGRVETVPAPSKFARILDDHRIIHEYEMRRTLGEQLANSGHCLSRTIAAALENGAQHTDGAVAEAIDGITGARAFFTQLFNDFDAILTPAAAGEAVARASGTGDPVFCTIWTFAGLPCVTLPLLVGENGLPVGVQLVGGLESDDRLIRTAGWLISQLKDGS